MLFLGINKYVSILRIHSYYIYNINEKNKTSVSKNNKISYIFFIEYLGNVLQELGSNTTNQLQEIALVLRTSPENYLSTSSGCEPRLVTAIRQMRHIISTA